MILLDTNNKVSITYSTATKLVCEEYEISNKQFKKDGVLPNLNQMFYNKVRKAFFNLVLSDLSKIIKQYSNTYGDLVITDDYDKANYWLKQLSPIYKANRDDDKRSDFEKLVEKERFTHKTELVQYFRDAGLTVLDKLSANFMKNEKASIEADHIIAVLTRLPGKHLIISNDGDYAQATIKDNVKIYHPIERKIRTYTKKEINDKNLKSIILGQAKDSIMNIKYESEISDDFIKWMDKTYDVEITKSMINILKEKYSDYMETYKQEKAIEDNKLILEGKRKIRRNLTAYNKPNLGDKGYEDLIKAYTVEEILNMNPIYRDRFELNKKLYDFTLIPNEIVIRVLQAYREYIKTPNIGNLQKFCTMYGINYTELS